MDVVKKSPVLMLFSARGCIITDYLLFVKLADQMSGHKHRTS